MVDTLLGHGVPVGQMAEVQQHFRLQGPISYPLAMLETRAVTAAPSNVGTATAGHHPYTFPQSAAGFVGVDMPTVGVGEVVFPILTKELEP